MVGFSCEDLFLRDRIPHLCLLWGALGWKNARRGWSVSEAISRRRLLVIVVVRCVCVEEGGVRHSGTHRPRRRIAHGVNLSCSFLPFLPPLSLLTFLHLLFVSSLSPFNVGEELMLVVEKGGGGTGAVREGVKCVYMCVFVCTAEGGVDMMRLQCCRDGLAEWLWGVCSLVFEHTANSLYTLPLPPHISLQIFMSPSQYLSLSFFCFFFFFS